MLPALTVRARTILAEMHLSGPWRSTNPADLHLGGEDGQDAMSMPPLTLITDPVT